MSTESNEGTQPHQKPLEGQQDLPLEQGHQQTTTDVSVEQSAGTPSVKHQPDQQQTLQALLGQVGRQALHNFKGEPIEVWRKTAQATGPNCIEGRTIAGKEFPLVEFYMHPVQVVSQRDGEIIDAVRTVLFDKGGTAYSFVSETINQGMAQLFGVNGFGPWEPPLMIRVTMGTSRSGNNVYSVEPA